MVENVTNFIILLIFHNEKILIKHFHNVKLRKLRIGLMHEMNPDKNLNNKYN